MIIIYGVPSCKYCNESIQILDNLGKDYKYINLKDPKERDAREFYRSLKVKTAPIIVKKSGDEIDWILCKYKKRHLLSLLRD